MIIIFGSLLVVVLVVAMMVLVIVCSSISYGSEHSSGRSPKIVSCNVRVHCLLIFLTCKIVASIIGKCSKTLNAQI